MNGGEERPYALIVRDGVEPLVMMAEREGRHADILVQGRYEIAYNYMWSIIEHYVRAGFIVSFSHSEEVPTVWYVCDPTARDGSYIRSAGAIQSREQASVIWPALPVVEFFLYDPSSLTQTVQIADATRYDETEDPIYGMVSRGEKFLA